MDSNPDNAMMLPQRNGTFVTLKHRLYINIFSFAAPDGYMVNFNYDRGTGLIESKVDSANLGYVYRYNKFGRLVGAVYPTGEKVDLQFNLTSSDGARIQVTRNGRPYRSVTVRDNQVSQQDDAANTAAAAVRGKRAAVITVGKDKTLKR